VLGSKSLTLIYFNIAAYQHRRVVVGAMFDLALAFAYCRRLSGNRYASSGGALDNCAVLKEPLAELIPLLR
jgi:hypothetical protein